MRPSRPDRAKRVRVPTILQMEAVECGAACLAMILAHYHRHVPLEILRGACGVSRDGTSASGLLAAAQAQGLIAQGFSGEPRDLEQFRPPFVVFWEFNHFVVVEGFGRNKVYLNDPATGPRAVSTGEFDIAFTGVVLTFEPGADFIEGGRRRGVWDGLGRRMRGSRLAFTFVVLASFGLIVPGLLVPALSRIFVDDYLIQGFTSWLPPLLIGMVGAALLRAGLSWLRQHYLLRLQTKLALLGSSRFFWRVLRLPVSFFLQRYAGEIASRVILNDRVAELIAGDLTVAVMGLLTMVVYAAIMAAYDVTLTGLAIVFALLNLLAFALVARRLSDGSQRLLIDEGKMIGVTVQGLRMIESIKASGGEDLFFSRWAGHLSKVINTAQTLSRTRLFLNISPILLSMLGSAAILAFGGFRVMDGTISIGTLVAFQALMYSFSAPLADLVHLGGQLQEAAADINRLDDILINKVDPEFAPEISPSSPRKRGQTGASVLERLSSPRTGIPAFAPGSAHIFLSCCFNALSVIPAKAGIHAGGRRRFLRGKSDADPSMDSRFRGNDGDDTEIPKKKICAYPSAFAGMTKGNAGMTEGDAARVKLTGHVRLQAVTFGFSATAPPLIRNFSLDLAPGTRVALVGPSGSGKSTIGKLIAGLYQPWSGQILFDGLPATTIPRGLLRRSLAMVDQEIVLFSGSVADNISLWDPTMPEERIIHAAHDALIHEEIAARPESYDCQLAEGGRNFSGGQRQRIEIARALAGDPTILILDEATSALDTTLEKGVIDAIRWRGCSCLIIAHRLSTIRDCDEIIVLDQGGVVERGRHDDLIAANGLYRQLVES